MNKKLIAILTLVMFALTLLPMGAFAETNNVPLQTIQVSSGSSVLVSDIRITETEITEGSIASGNTITLTPMNGVKFDITKPFIVRGTIGDANAFTKGTFAPESITYTMTSAVPAGAGTRNSIVFQGIYVDTRSMSGNDVIIDVATTQPSGITPGKVTVATKSSKATTTTVLSQEKFQVGKTNQSVGTIRITEKIADSIAKDGTTQEIRIQSTSKEVKLIDPALYPVTTPPTPLSVTPVGGGVKIESVSLEKETDNVDGYTAIVLKVKDTGDTQSFVDVSNILVQITDKASLGDISLKVSGTGDVTTETLVIGSVRDYGVELIAPSTLTTLFAGDEKEEVKTFYMEETGSASIIGNGRTLKLTLPTNTAWQTAPKMGIDKGDTSFTPQGDATLEDNGRTAVYTMNAAGFTNQATKFKFTGGQVAAKATAAAGDLTVTLSGSSNVTGEIVIGAIKKPVTVEASSSDVQIGKNAQPVGDIIIKEVKAGYIKAATAHKTIIVRLPERVKASATPTVEVIEGDLKIDKVERADSDRNIVITVDSVSSVPSTIKISGLKVDLDRTLAEGPYNFTVTGSALNRVGVKDAYDIGDEDNLDTKETDAVASFQGMVVVTPAQDGVVKPVVMTVGSTVYTIDGVEMTMDVAPYIKDARTYFPVRYVAQALGITADNVVWDNAQRTVTIFRGNRIVQVTIGSRTMLVNGVPLTMDVAPEITADRTMLPIRFVAQGLGVNVDWDDATRTITLN